MFVYAEMLAPHVEGIIDLPEDMTNYDREKFPHWHVYRLLHQGVPIDVWFLSDNARVIAEIPTAELVTLTITQLIDKGLRVVM